MQGNDPLAPVRRLWSKNQESPDLSAPPGGISLGSEGSASAHVGWPPTLLNRNCKACLFSLQLCLAFPSPGVADFWRAPQLGRLRSDPRTPSNAAPGALLALNNCLQPHPDTVTRRPNGYNTSGGEPGHPILTGTLPKADSPSVPQGDAQQNLFLHRASAAFNYSRPAKRSEMQMKGDLGGRKMIIND